MNKFFKKNLPVAIIAAVLLAVVILIGALLKESFNKDGYRAPTDKTKNGNDIQVDNEKNNDLNNEENESNNKEDPELETYKSELFIEAKWGAGKGEVGLFNPSEQGIEDAGPNYGPQSFDIDESTGHLFLLDSINERVIEYGENGKYLRDFSIGIGATTDIKIKDENIYILSFGSDAVYKLDMSGKILETYLITPGKNPGVGTGGIEFDENGNVMVHINIDGYYNEESRFYQIGKNGDEWKTNSYIGNITRDKKGFYFIKGIDWLTRKVQTLDRSGSVQKEFTVKLPQKAYVYYYGSDENNIYLNVAFEHGNMDDGYYFDEFIWKYSKDGKLLTKIDRDIFVNNLSQESRIEILSNPETNGAYTREFRKVRITDIENIYLMLPFKEKGIQIFKYSKIDFPIGKLEEAEESLNEFLYLLNIKDYKKAVEFYGGEYELLRGYNPYEDSNDYPALLENWCEHNGGNCFKHEIINKKIMSDNIFWFEVKFFDENGDIFIVPLPHPLEGEGASTFSFTVKKIKNYYKVMDLPPYAS